VTAQHESVPVGVLEVLLALKATARVEAVQALMEQYRIRRVVVLDNEGYPVGIVSVNDLVRIQPQNTE
jgi:CBS domain-containing protein